ncbi:MAG TPA: hypothetical protein VM658_04615 [bacterium]|nr:hypothetical protein [bacterium]
MKKDFDCVQMKHEIQRKLMKEFEGLSREERKKIAEERINADPILGPIWRNARRVGTTGLVDSADRTTTKEKEKRA